MTGSLRAKGKYYQYVFRYKDVDGITQQKSISTKVPVKGNNKRKAERIGKELAEKWLEDYNHYKSADGWTFNEWIEYWISFKSATLRESTIQSYRYNYQHIQSFFTDILLVDVTKDMISDYYQKKIDDGLSPNTIHKHHVVISGALKEAYNREFIEANPADRVRLPQKIRYEADVYTADEARELISSLDDYDVAKPIIILGLCYGLRRGEVCGLRWQDVDLDNGIIHICNTVTRIKTEIEQEATKSKASNRYLPLTEKDCQYFKLLKERQAEFRKRLNNAQLDPVWHVCQTRKGTPAKPKFVNTEFRNFLNKNGLRKIKLHELRHTTATLLTSQCTNLKFVQDFMGHEDISTTMKRYAHLGMTGKKESANILGTILNAN